MYFFCFSYFYITALEKLVEMSNITMQLHELESKYFELLEEKENLLKLQQPDTI